MSATRRLLRRRIRRRDPEPLTSISIKTFRKHELVGHQGSVRSFVFLQDNEHIVSGSSDGTMRKWDCERGLSVGEPWKVGEQVFALALSPDGKTVACGRRDGSVERWDTNGRMTESIWAGHRDWVRALSWSPSGHHLASGSDDGTILIRISQSGQVKIGPINANQGMVYSVAYSPSGDRIASGGDNISIWDSHTGELRVGPIQADVYSIVWSLDGSKLYASGRFARVLDSVLGTELHRFQHDSYLYSIALSPKHSLLAGVGQRGIVYLWDIETYQPLGQPFYLGRENNEALYSVSFSPDGRYLAYVGEGRKITLRIVKDGTQELTVPQASGINPPDDTQQKALPKSPSSSCLNTDPLAQSAVQNDNACNQPYNSFFTPSKSSLPLSLPKPSTSRFKAAFSPWVPHLRTLKGKLRTGNHDKECDSANRPRIVAPGATERNHDKGEQREELIAHKQIISLDDLSSPAELDNNENRTLWKLLRSRKINGKKPSPRETQCSSPDIVEVFAARGFKRTIVHKRKRKTKSLAPIFSNPTTLVNAERSSHGDPTNPLSQGIPAPSSQPRPIAGYPGPSWPTETSCTDNDSCSDSSSSTIRGPCLRFLQKICFSC